MAKSFTYLILSRQTKVQTEMLISSYVVSGSRGMVHGPWQRNQDKYHSSFAKINSHFCAVPLPVILSSTHWPW